jgi:AraC-like DNA-binding protein
MRPEVLAFNHPNIFSLSRIFFLWEPLFNLQCATMVKQIPTLQKDTFKKVYFKHDVPPPLVNRPSIAPYFEINHRCIWPSDILAHRLDFYMLFIVTHGEGQHILGPREFTVSKNMLGFAGPHVIRSWHAAIEDQRGYFVTFSESFFNKGFENKLFLTELPFFQMDGDPTLSLDDDQMNEFLYLFSQMHKEYHQGADHSNDILRTQLQLILHKANVQVKKTAGSPSAMHGSRMHLVKNFKALFLRDFHSFGPGKTLAIKNVSVYADELAVSQNYLNDTIKALTGKSAGQLLREQVILQASSCLLHADKSIGEIAFALGFDDPSYFARFYKNQTGQSPTAYREANLNP